MMFEGDTCERRTIITQPFTDDFVVPSDYWFSDPYGYNLSVWQSSPTMPPQLNNPNREQMNLTFHTCWNAGSMSAEPGFRLACAISFQCPWWLVVGGDILSHGSSCETLLRSTAMCISVVCLSVDSMRWSGVSQEYNQR